jgi:tetratricopeptide (TPR) repeat protein
MEMETNKLLQQAGKFVVLGKLGLALEKYLRIHELNPEDTTIINTIGDVYLRLGKETEALLWYEKLAEAFESRELFLSAAAAYKKILRLSPNNGRVMIRLAESYERQGLTKNAKLQHRLIARQMMSLGEHAQVVAAHRKICDLDPRSPDSHLELARVLQELGRAEESSQAYLQGAELLVLRGETGTAVTVAETLFRLKPGKREVFQPFFQLLRKIGLTERGAEYLESLSLDQDPEVQVMLGEAFLQDGNLDRAQKYLLGAGRCNPKVYAASLKLLERLIASKEVKASVDAVYALYETSLQLHDEVTLKMMLHSLLDLDPSNLRTLKMLTALLIRLNDREKLEEYLKKLVLLQLQSGDLQGARDSLNKMVVHGQGSFYLDMLKQLDEAIVSRSPRDLEGARQKVLQTLELGPEKQEISDVNIGLALGVSELDLGIDLDVPPREQLAEEEFIENAIGRNYACKEGVEGPDLEK